MQRVDVVEHKGKNIVILDFSKLDMLDQKDELFSAIEEAKAYISRQLPNSLLTLTIAKELRFNKDLIETLKEFTAHNKPYVKAGAIIGIQGLQKIAYDMVMTFTRRNIPIFPTVEEAKDWLVQQ